MLAIGSGFCYNTLAWPKAAMTKNHTPGDRALQVPLRRCKGEMIGVEAKTKKEIFKMAGVSMKQFLAAGVHFGHQTFFFNDNLST